MAIRNRWNRRTFLGRAGVLAGVVRNARNVFGMPKTATTVPGLPEKLTGLGASGNVYEELGVTTVINGQGTIDVPRRFRCASRSRSGDGARIRTLRNHRGIGTRRGQTHL